MNKLISIIIPVYNGEKYIAETINAINAQNMNVEIIVVNDFSTDKTAEIASTLGCNLINHEKNQGQVVAKNTALKIAKGDYIMFHDADDVMNENVLSQMYDELENNSEISAVMCKVKDFISPDTIETNTTQIKKEAYFGLFTGAVLMRKSVFDKIGLFTENINTGEIIEWQGKMQANNLLIKKLDIISTNRRVHDTNFGKTNQKTEYLNYAAVLRAKLGKK